MKKKPIDYQWLYVFTIWLIATLINIQKAYHIDDTFHLEAGSHILNNPKKPMSGYINWDDYPKPMYHHNQPAFFFYIIALTQHFFGQSEIIMHLMLSIFTFFCLYYFLKLIHELKIQSKTYLLLLFGFSPTFLINQNIMTDIPVLSVMLAMYYHLLKAQMHGSTKHYFIASLLLSIGLLFKYALLPFVIVFLFTALFSRHLKSVFFVFIPVTALVIWGYWNFHEYGSIHILNRPKIIFKQKLIFDYMGTLGSVTLFTPIYKNSIFFKNIKSGITSIIGLIIASYAIHFTFFKIYTAENILSSFFITNGMLLLLFFCFSSFKTILKEKLGYFKSPSFVLILGIIGISLFIIIFAPFNATRHILIFFPLILLYGHLNFELVSGRIKTAVIMIHMAIGILLSISDWKYANFYRDTAESIKKNDNTYWSFGHWGWQWYSRKAGMSIYSTSDTSKLKVGDYIFYPVYVPKQAFPKGLELDTIKIFAHKPDLFTYFSVSNARFYNSSVKKPSWTLSSEPYDIIYQFRIRKIQKP